MFTSLQNIWRKCILLSMQLLLLELVLGQESNEFNNEDDMIDTNEIAGRSSSRQLGLEAFDTLDMTVAVGIGVFFLAIAAPITSAAALALVTAIQSGGDTPETTSPTFQLPQPVTTEPTAVG